MPKRTSLLIENVTVGSPAEKVGVRPGDRILEINGHPIRDIIDVRFYSADELLDCTFLRGDIKRWIRFRTEEGQGLGLEFEPMHFLACGNRCIFCFVDQNPEGLRSSLYFKDEDYRLSFLYGNYVTLTHVGEEELDRIVDQRLSPLYVSIHATDSEVRGVMLGLKKKDGLLDKLRFLGENNIEIHGQIVLCPGYNDEKILRDSLETLSTFYPRLRSLSVVPVGLTCHRHDLSRLREVDFPSAVQTLEIVEGFQDLFTKRLGDPFVCLSDEFYLMAGEPLPPLEHYGDLWQVENGVGLTRSFLEEFARLTEEFPEKLDQPRRFVLVTGTLAGPILEREILPRLRRIGNLRVDMRVVVNRFFGESVTVSGLLTGRDIIDVFREDEDEGVLLLPPNCLNGDGLFLDDLSPRDLSRELNRTVVVSEDFKHIWKAA